MKKLTRIVLGLLWLCIMEVRQAAAQPSLLFEAGATYFTNDIPTPNTNLADFLAFSVNTRINLKSLPNSAFSLDIPVSIRSRFTGQTVTRFGFHLPALITWNAGAGASANPSNKKLGFLIGAGVGFFYQQSKSDYEETPIYNEKLTVFGPAAQMGIRFPVNVNLFKVGEREVRPSVAIKFIYQADIKNRDHDIGAISVMLGLIF